MNWTILAAVGEPAAVALDPRGLLVPDTGGWSLDWWIGAEDRWHHASEEAAVRQRLGEAGVAVETLMRVPGGDIVQTVWVCVAPGGGGPVAVIELRNESAVPVAAAVAVRPRDLQGRGGVAAHVDGTAIRAAGRVLVQLPAAPADTFTDRLEEGDLAAVSPLPHAATTRFAVPLAAPDGVADAQSLPGPDVIARGWEAHLGRGARVDIPDAGLQRVFEVARRRVLGACARGVHSFPAIDRPLNELDLALVTTALAELGHVTELAEALDSLGWRGLPDFEPPVDDVLSLAATASPTGAIASPEAGDDLAAAATMLLGSRRLLLADAGGGELAFLPQLPRGWAGQAVEIHDAPTSAGQVSVAVRWHGARPALLWTAEGTGPFRLAAPGLDGNWETGERRGEALLDPFVDGDL